MLMITFERFMLIDYNLKFLNDYLNIKSIFPNFVLVDEYFLSLFAISVLQNPTNEASYIILLPFSVHIALLVTCTDYRHCYDYYVVGKILQVGLKSKVSRFFPEVTSSQIMYKQLT
jgi:hypothetical protein